MEPSGMVHALELARQLLLPNGRLLDLHPTGEPPPIEIRMGTGIRRVGFLRETDDFVEYGLADAAVARVIREGLFVIEKSDQYSFDIHADGLEELLSYLAEEWTDAVIDDDIVKRIESLLSSSVTDKEIILRDRIYIARLRPG
jgi:hypothetical protein